MALELLTVAELKAFRRGDLIEDLSGGDDSVVEEQIERAEGRAKGVLLAGPLRPEDLPTDPADAVPNLKRVVAELAEFYLTKWRHARVPEDVRVQFQDALAELREMRQGQQALVLTDAPDADSYTGSTAISTRSSRLSDPGYDVPGPMTLESLRDW